VVKGLFTRETAVPVRQRKSATAGPTVLERHLTGNGHATAATPVDAFNAARRTFLRGERVDMGVLAADLGVSRATLYRWVGDRDQLLGEVMWSVASIGLDQARADAAGDGVEWLLDIYWKFGDLIIAFDPVRRFVENEPECALRVMTSKHSPHQKRVVEYWRDLLLEAERERGLVPKLDADTMAYVLIRIAESFLWSDLITGEPSDRAKAQEVARALLT
jgi:AcrR family transcriptional regulator